MYWLQNSKIELKYDTIAAKIVASCLAAKVPITQRKPHFITLLTLLKKDFKEKYPQLITAIFEEFMITGFDEELSDTLTDSDYSHITTYLFIILQTEDFAHLKTSPYIVLRYLKLILFTLEQKKVHHWELRYVLQLMKQYCDKCVAHDCVRDSSENLNFLSCITFIGCNEPSLAWSLEYLKIIPRLKLFLNDDDANRVFSNFLSVLRHSCDNSRTLYSFPFLTEAIATYSKIIGEARFNDFSEGGNSFLGAAIEYGRWDVVSVLLRHYDKTVTNEIRQTVVEKCYKPMLRKLDTLQYLSRQQYLGEPDCTLLAPALNCFLRDLPIDLNGEEFLHKAVLDRDINTFHFLLERKIDVNELNSEGLTAHDVANCLLGKFPNQSMSDMAARFLITEEEAFAQQKENLHRMETTLREITHTPNPSIIFPLTIPSYQTLAPILLDSKLKLEQFSEKRIAALKKFCLTETPDKATIKSHEYRKKLPWDILFNKQRQFIKRMTSTAAQLKVKIGDNTLSFLDAREEKDFELLIHTTSTRAEQFEDTLKHGAHFIKKTHYFSASLVDKETNPADMSHQGSLIFTVSLIIQSSSKCVLRPFPRDIASPRVTTLEEQFKDNADSKALVEAEANHFKQELQRVAEHYNKAELALLSLHTNQKPEVSNLAREMRIDPNVVFSILEDATVQEELVSENKISVETKYYKGIYQYPVYTPKDLLKKTTSYYNEIMIQGDKDNVVVGLLVQESSLHNFEMTYSKMTDWKDEADKNTDRKDKADKNTDWNADWKADWKAKADKSLKLLCNSPFPLILVKARPDPEPAGSWQHHSLKLNMFDRIKMLDKAYNRGLNLLTGLKVREYRIMSYKKDAGSRKNDGSRFDSDLIDIHIQIEETEARLTRYAQEIQDLPKFLGL